MIYSDVKDEMIMGIENEEFRGKCTHKPQVQGNCEYVEGNITKPIEIDKNTKACEIRADIQVSKKRSIRIWGQIKDCYGRPVRCALVKLVKEIVKCGKLEFEGVAHGVTDCLGFYQFDICVPENPVKYRVLVSKPSIGGDIRVDKTECEPCRDNCDCV